MVPAIRLVTELCALTLGASALRQERVRDPAEYNENGYMEIEKALRESSKRACIGSLAPGLKQAAGVEPNEISRHFHSRALLSEGGSQSFNPSIVVLPPAIAQRFGPDKAYYLATIRHDDGSCANLGSGPATKGRTGGGSETSLVVLRRDLSVLASTGIHGSDCRLYENGGQIWLTRMVFHPKWRDIEMLMQEIDVSPNMSPTGSHTKKLDMQFGKLAKSHWGTDRNLGALRDGSGKLLLMREIDFEVDMLDTIAQRSAHALDTIAQRGPVHMHNNINPVELREQNAFLGIGHVHLEIGCTRHCKKDMPRYGWRYVHTFFTFDRESPFAIRKVSPPFCIPTTSNSSRCETIQFITSAIREGPDLLVTYGINDCEAGVLRVPLGRVLDFVEKGGAPSASPDSARLFAPVPVQP